MTSPWYVKSGCLETKSLKPWIIIITGFVTQLLLMVLFTRKQFSDSYKPLHERRESQFSYNSTAENDEINDTDNSPNNGSSIKQLVKKFNNMLIQIQSNKYFRILQYIYLIWQVISIIIIFCIDIGKFLDYSNKSHINHTSWDDSLCLASILIESSNYTTLLLMLLLFYLNMIGDVIRSDNKYKSSRIGTESDEYIWIKGKFLTYCCRHGCSRHMFKHVRIIIALIMYVIGYIWIWIVFLFPGVIVFPFFVVFICFCICGATKIGWNPIERFIDIISAGNDNDNDNDNETKCEWVKKIFYVIVLLFFICGVFCALIFLCFMLLYWTPLWAINLYSGMNYVDCVASIFDDRNWNDYSENIIANPASLFAFVCSIFG